MKSESQRIPLQGAPLARAINRVVFLLQATLILLVVVSLCQWLAGLFGYMVGIVVAAIVGGSQFVLGRYVKKFHKAKWLIWLPTTLALLAPLLYIAFKVVFSGSLLSAAIKLIFPFLFGAFLPVLMLWYGIVRLKRILTFL
jgi:hypothetical protein